MKKIILLIVLFFLLAANKCVDTPEQGTTYVYERTYNSHQQNLSVSDAFAQLKKYNVDSVGMERWLINRMVTDSAYIWQRVIISYRDTSRYDFIYLTFLGKDSTWYQLKVRQYVNPKKNK